MKISLNWLNDFFKIDKDYNEISKILTDIGLEISSVEKFQSVKGGLEGLVIGEVKTCEKHKNADKLSVTTVDIGDKILPIVCGAPNVAAGQKVVVATVGTVLYDGDQSFKIKKSKIRGEISEGMICAEDEIGLGNMHDGIMVLDNNVKPGLPAKEYFKIDDDIVFEIDLTPNRIDAASHYGVARDLAAYFNQFKKTKINKIPVDDFKIDNNNNIINVKIENNDACHRYSGITISNVNVTESPDWIKNRLKAIGLTPINNVVDITNYVLHEVAQPLHAFDADKISGNEIIVKTLPKDTKFVTLDGIERKLNDNDLMICDKDKGLCIAGVFGGAESGVTKQTKNIFLESAYFDSVYIRKTAKRHALNTDASFRFERGTDPNITIYALKRAASLIKKYAGGEISSEIIDVYPNPVKNKIINVLYKNINRLIGKDLGEDKIKTILNGLEINILDENDYELTLEIPAYRVDVTREADVIEEILRIYGYNNIEISNNVKSAISYNVKPDKHKVTNIISDYLSSVGFVEIMSNSLTKSKYFDNNNYFNGNRTVKILNPLSSDLDAMRQTLLFGGLESILHNKNRKNKDLKIYEFGNIYFYDNKKTENPQHNYSQQNILALFITGNKQKVNWNLKEEKTSFFELKSYSENILIRLGFKINDLKINLSENKIFEQSIKYIKNDKNILELGIINNNLLNDFDLDQDVFYAEFNFDNVLKLLKNIKTEYVEISKYPFVKRDLALLIDNTVSFNEIKLLAEKTEKKILKEVSMFDFYKGKNIDNNKKSYGVSFIFQDKHKTLNDKQIDKIMNNLIRVFEKELGAVIR